MSWKEFSVGVAAVAVAFGFLVGFIALLHWVSRATAACPRVIECLDLGVERESCDSLFPGCEKPEES